MKTLHIHLPHPRRGREDLGPGLALAREDLDRLARRVADLRHRIDVTPGADAAAAAHLAAFEELGAARRDLDDARTPADLTAAVARLAAGDRMLAAIEADLSDEPRTDTRDPCLFDPAHGPETTEATWTSTSLGTHRVRVCDADADLLRQRRPPRLRTVQVQGRSVPYWDAAPAYFTGWFGDQQAYAWLRPEGTRSSGGTSAPPPHFQGRDRHLDHF